MIHSSKSLRPWLEQFHYPIPVFSESGCSPEYVTEKRLKQLLELEIVVGYGRRNKINQLRYTVNDRQRMALLRISRPDELRKLPVVGDPLKMLMLRTKRSIRAIRPL